MKKLVFIVIILFAISKMAIADIIIQKDFDGIILGQSTRDEVNKNLTSKGLVFSEENTDTVDYNIYLDFFTGEYLHNGMYFDGIVSRFINDTLVMLSFNSFCDTACVEYAAPFIKNIHPKYNQLTDAGGSLVVMMLLSDVDGLTTWSRKDEETAIITLHNDSTFICTYVAEDKVWDFAISETFKNLTELSPNYAEENKVYGVGGVKFGDSKALVKSVISPKSASVVDQDSHSITFRDTKIGGVTYDFATFYFSSDKLISVNLQNAFNSWSKEEALMQFESVKSQYGRKYTNMNLLKDEDDLKGYNCGAYIDGYDYLPILISFQKSLSQGGNIMYYVQVDYYGHRTDNLYDDEI